MTVCRYCLSQAGCQWQHQHLPHKQSLGWGFLIFVCWPKVALCDSFLPVCHRSWTVFVAFVPTVQSYGAENIVAVGPTSTLIIGPIRVPVPIRNGSTGDPCEWSCYELLLVECMHLEVDCSLWVALSIQL